MTNFCFLCVLDLELQPLRIVNFRHQEDFISDESKHNKHDSDDKYRRNVFTHRTRKNLKAGSNGWTLEKVKGNFY